METINELGRDLGIPESTIRRYAVTFADFFPNDRWMKSKPLTWGTVMHCLPDAAAWGNKQRSEYDDLMDLVIEKEEPSPPVKHRCPKCSHIYTMGDSANIPKEKKRHKGGIHCLECYGFLPWAKIDSPTSEESVVWPTRMVHGIARESVELGS